MIRKNKILLLIVIIPLIFIVPVNLLLLYHSQRQVDYARKEIVSENEMMLQMYTGILEKEMLQIESYMELLVEEKYPYVRMAEEGFDQREPDFYTVQNQLISEFESYRVSNEMVTSVIAYFPAADVYISRCKGLSQKKEVVDAFRGILDHAGEQEHLGGENNWYFFQLNEDVYLANIYMEQGSKCMITMSVNELLEGIQGELKLEGYRYYFLLQGCYFKEKDQRLQQWDSSLSDMEEVEIDGQTYYNSTIQLSGCNLYLGGLVQHSYLNDRIPGNIRILSVISALSCLVGPIICIIFLIIIEHPLRQLNTGMSEVQKGNTEYRIPLKNQGWQSEFDELNLHFNLMLDKLEHTKIQLYQEQIDRQKVQLRYLNQQIRPHFILNALNIIYMYEDDEFPAAKKMVIYLTKYFRYLVNLKSDYVMLWEEMEHMDNYLKIQKVRYPERFTYFVEWEEELRQVKVPAVVIQTFVENSIKYGMEKGKPMFIFVLARRLMPDRMLLMVADTGRGFSTEQLEGIRQFMETRRYNESLGVGIQNVVSRLDILYGTDYQITIGNAIDGGARIELELPCQTGTGDMERFDKLQERKEGQRI